MKLLISSSSSEITNLTLDPRDLGRPGWAKFDGCGDFGGIGTSGSFSGSFEGSFNSSDVKDSLPSGTVSSSAQLATDISGSFAQASSSLETNKASKGFAIAMSVAL